MFSLGRLLFGSLVAFARPRAALSAEILALRHQLGVFERSSGRVGTLGKLDGVRQGLEPGLNLVDNNVWYSLVTSASEAETVPKNTSIALNERFTDFIEEQVAAGRYGNASEVIRAGLRLLEEREAKLRSLRQAIDDGLKSGPAEKFDVEEFIAARTRNSKRG